MALNITSPAFEAGERMPDRFTCDGENIAPPLAWRPVPEEAESLALIFDDVDAADENADGPAGHWVIYNIPVGTYQLPENFDPEDNPDWGILRGRNSFGNTGYEGPCPPRGEQHRYYFRLYALDARLDLGAGATRAQLIDAMHGHILEKKEMMLHYQRVFPRG